MNIPECVWALVLLAVAVGVFCVSLPILASQGAVSIDIFTQLASLVVSWPVAFVVVALVFMSRFRGALDFWLRSIRQMKFPGVEIQSHAPAPPEPTQVPEEGTVSLTPKQQAELSAFIQSLEEQQKLTQDAKKQIEAQYQKAFFQVIAWRWAYLNLFFVPNTKLVLHWLYTWPRQTRANFEAAWAAYIPNPNERAAILDALLGNGMVQEPLGVLEVTPEGEAFLQHIGRVQSVNQQQT